MKSDGVLPVRSDRPWKNADTPVDMGRDSTRFSRFRLWKILPVRSDRFKIICIYMVKFFHSAGSIGGGIYNGIFSFSFSFFRFASRTSTSPRRSFFLFFVCSFSLSPFARFKKAARSGVYMERPRVGLLKGGHVRICLHVCRVRVFDYRSIHTQGVVG